MTRSSRKVPIVRHDLLALSPRHDIQTSDRNVGSGGRALASPRNSVSKQVRVRRRMGVGVDFSTHSYIFLIFKN